MDEQGLVGLAGLGLIAVNFWTSSQRQSLGGTIMGSKVNTADAHRAAVGLGAEGLFVMVAWIIAGASPNWSHTMLAVMIGLWLLWAINATSSGKLKRPAQTPSTLLTASAA